LLTGDFPIPASYELDQAEAIAEGVGHVGDAPPFVCLDIALKLSPGSFFRGGALVPHFLVPVVPATRTVFTILSFLENKVPLTVKLDEE
jgi:hypothetical protein